MASALPRFPAAQGRESGQEAALASGGNVPFPPAGGRSATATAVRRAEQRRRHARLQRKPFLCDAGAGLRCGRLRKRGDRVPRVYLAAPDRGQRLQNRCLGESVPTWKSPWVPRTCGFYGRPVLARSVGTISSSSAPRLPETTDRAGWRGCPPAPDRCPSASGGGTKQHCPSTRRSWVVRQRVVTGQQPLQLLPERFASASSSDAGPLLASHAPVLRALCPVRRPLPSAGKALRLLLGWPSPSARRQGPWRPRVLQERRERATLTGDLDRCADGENLPSKKLPRCDPGHSCISTQSPRDP